MAKVNFKYGKLARWIREENILIAPLKIAETDGFSIS